VAEEPKVYVSLEAKEGHLVINGPLALLRELLNALNQQSNSVSQRAEISKTREVAKDGK
jgi:malonyl CoA-acyl carrier protein transacylase